MKICFKCNTEKELSDFYRHSQMSDGRLNKCKVCTKEESKNNYYEKSKSIEFNEKERIRSREKYYRLNYNKKSHDYKKNKPWLNSSKYKNLNRKFKVPTGYELHHWSYNNEDIEDVFLMKKKQHRQAHTYIKFNLETKMFIDLDGNLLKTKKEHLEYLIKKNIQF